MTKVLVLGGTGWLSGRIARRWIGAGAAVTCLARGSRAPFEGATLVAADRDQPDAYAEVTGEWDHVVDITSRADHAAAAVTALGDHAARWTCVSSVSVYADDVTIDADETAPLHDPARPGDEYDYSAQKVAAERSVASLGDRALIVRPGLIVGDGDPSDRFGYWPAAFARAGAEDVLVPAAAARLTQVIDVDDLAAFLMRTRATGIVNAVGDRHPLADVLALCREVAAHRGNVVEIDDDRLLAQGVQHWMGERSLPLWLPAEMTGFMTRSNAAYRAAGGTVRPLADTIERVLADERARGLDRDRRAGLSRAEEREMLAAR